MFLIIELGMLIGGVYIIVSTKGQSFIIDRKYQVTRLVARWLGILLILPLPVALLGYAILPSLFGNDGRIYAGKLELFIGLGSLVLSIALILLTGKRVGQVNSTLPTKTSPLQLTLYLVMVVTLILGIWVRVMAPGWFLVFSCIPLLLVAGRHFVVQVIAIRRISSMKPSYLPLILLSNLFFFLGFALQVDFGDQGSGYLALIVFYDYYFKHGVREYLANGQFNIYMYTSIAFLVALIISWFFLRGNSLLKQENSN